MVTIEKVTEGDSLGEGPHWDIASQTLYFVDIPKRCVLKYNPTTNKTTKVKFDKTPSFVIPVEGKTNQFVIAQDSELVIIEWDGVSDKASVIEKLCTLESTPEVPKTFNDAKCDSSGRLWAGCHSADHTNFMNSKPLGTLYSFDKKQRQLISQVDKIRISNGLAFNENARKMFYIDSLATSVDRFDFDINNGRASNREIWFTPKKHGISGLPDGMTIDSDGNLWVALFGGSCVVKVDGNKKETLLDTVSIPAEQVTSVAFGGKNLDELFVTTGNIDVEGKKPVLTCNGATFRVRGTGATGLPASNFKF